MTGPLCLLRPPEEVASCWEKEQESCMHLHQGDFSSPVSQVSLTGHARCEPDFQVTRG